MRRPGASRIHRISFTLIRSKDQRKIPAIVSFDSEKLSNFASSRGADADAFFGFPRKKLIKAAQGG
jgi:hypothetical protein